MVDKKVKEMHKYVAVFKVYNGESTYSILVKTEALNKKDARNYFKMYECNNNTESWKFEKMVKVKTFKDLWDLI